MVREHQVLTCCAGRLGGLTERQLDGFQLDIILQTRIIYELWVQISYVL